MPLNEILPPTNISNPGVVVPPPHITALSSGGCTLTYRADTDADTPGSN
jgi:hypothetical protein